METSWNVEGFPQEGDLDSVSHMELGITTCEEPLVISMGLCYFWGDVRD